MKLDAGDLDLPQDLVVFLELPDIRGVWRVVTFVPAGQK
jgi:hypothetical protein